MPQGGSPQGLGAVFGITGTKATGTIVLSGQPADADTITIDDGTNTATIFEFDSGVVATGTLELTVIPVEGDTITISDGATAKTFEFDIGDPASGSIELTSNPADTNIITLTDGVNPASVFEFDVGVAATGTLGLTVNPVDADTITISDGVVVKTFEFDDGGGIVEGNVAVLLGGTNVLSMAALVAAINGVDGFAVTATAAGPADETCTLQNDLIGVAGNVAITHVWAADNLVHTGMAGGLAAGTAITPGRVGVAIGATAPITMANLIVAINGAADLVITATAATPAGVTCTLESDRDGVIGNVAVTKVGASITVTGMTNGGANAGTHITPGNVGVAIGATNVTAMAALIAAINGATGFNVTATATAIPDEKCTLANDYSGDTGNVAITHVWGTDNLVHTGMAGGVDASENIVSGHVGVPKSTTAALTMLNLVNVINGITTGLIVSATGTTPASATCTIRNDLESASGNAFMYKSGANIAVTGMSGGLDAITLRDMVINPASKTFPQLTVPGSTAWFPLDGQKNHTFAYTVANRDTNVSVKAEGSLDGVNAFLLTGTDATQTGNGTYYCTSTGIAIPYIRFTFVSEVGGTAATIDAKYYGV